MAKRHERTLARRQAIQVLYQGEIVGTSPEELLEDAGSFIDGACPMEYARALVVGTCEHRADIDELLKKYSENWSLDRMPMVDRAILRLASYEILYVDEVPTSVAINEAVDLAKDFGGEDESPRFVNGVLGRVAEFLDEGDEAAVSADSAVPVVTAAKPAEEAVAAEESAVPVAVPAENEQESL